MNNESDYAPDDATDKAFTASDNHAFGDIELQPWTPQRILAAQSCGLKYPNLSDEDRAQFKETGVYPGALRDTLLVLYLCTLPGRDEIRAAERKPEATREKAAEWGEARGIIDLRSDAFWQAYTKFIDIVSEERAATVVPKDTASGDPPSATPARSPNV